MRNDRTAGTLVQGYMDEEGGSIPGGWHKNATKLARRVWGIKSGFQGPKA